MKFRKPKLVYLPEGNGGMLPNTKSIETEYVNDSLLPTFSSSSASASAFASAFASASTSSSSSSSASASNDDDSYDDDNNDDDDDESDDDDDDEWTTHIEVSEKYKEKVKEKKSISNPNDVHRGRSIVTNDTNEAVAGYEVMGGKDDHRGRSVGNIGTDDERKKIVKQHEFWEQLQICETQSNSKESCGRLYLTDDFLPRSEKKKDTSSSTRRDSNVRRTSPSPLLSPLTTRVVKSSFHKRECRDEYNDENKNEDTLIEDMMSITVKDTIEVTVPPSSRRRKRSWRVGKWKFSFEKSKKMQK